MLEISGTIQTAFQGCQTGFETNGLGAGYIHDEFASLVEEIGDIKWDEKILREEVVD